MRKLFRVFAPIAALLLFAPISHAQPGAPSPASIARAEHQAEAVIAQLINAQRAEHVPDAPELQANGELDRIARERSNSMAHGGPFAHEDEQGRPAAMDMIKTRVSQYGYFGENIMMEMRENLPFNAQHFAQEAVDGWMASDGHRANILSPNYDRSGIGVVIVGDSAYATQVFYGPQRETPRPAAKR